MSNDAIIAQIRARLSSLNTADLMKVVSGLYADNRKESDVPYSIGMEILFDTHTDTGRLSESEFIAFCNKLDAM